MDERSTGRDGRSERWSQHRAQRREEFLDATFRALAERGPDVTMADIAAEAGVAKPRLYRYFGDKGDLFDAVAERTLRNLWQRLLPTLEVRDQPRRVVRTALDAYVGLVAENPNVVRFLIGSRFVERSWESDPVLDNGRKVAGVLAAMIARNLKAFGAPAGGAEPWANAVVGAVAAATEWWLETKTMTRDQLVDYLGVFVWGALDAALRSEGIALDPAEPVSLNDLVRKSEP
ncbi:TetR/AcrR family transcriptional regulator [Amycolatopsis nigrescens]|uniref:TetR/AcrR family transcriptional regulator n=1 Tax=Amycolatopsis nigrescens TaxID=381445 RepID=UPI00146F8F13|nr:TetR/AcrR family transcriptional regulator [Amycolatopsis nigrescens]